MELVKLLSADIYRDGGSYSAEFLTGDGSVYSVFLHRSAMPDEKGLHHRYLYEYPGYERPADCLPVLTGSIEEQRLIEILNDFLAKTAKENHEESGEHYKYHLERLKELIHYIPLREPCFYIHKLS